MSTPITVKLSNGSELAIDPTQKDKAYSDFIDIFLKPFYQKSNDWNATIRESIKEIERISSILRMSKGELISELFANIDGRLSKDIAELRGTDKIEILFESLDDYIQNILQIVKGEGTQEEKRLSVSNLVESLNLFEISELLITFAKKM